MSGVCSTPASAASRSAPVAVQLAKVVLWLFSLACFVIAATRLGDWLGMALPLFGGMWGANFALNLARREVWAWQACQWIGLGGGGLMALFAIVFAVCVTADVGGVQASLRPDIAGRIPQLVVAVGLMVAAPAIVGVLLSRPECRDWFSEPSP